MECNKDEAIRAKIIAEKKWADNDFVGAKKFTQKAQTLYPGLDGISQFLIMLDVYISSESKVNGESDWYKVLNVDPSDDDETIRKQYKMLALKLHPDKNKSVGADGAFKIVSEAWSFLSDKDRRSAYNQRRNSHTPPNVNGDHDNSANRSTSNPENCKKTKSTQTKAHKRNKFWTICYRCKLYHVCRKKYLNHSIICPSCCKPFLAAEIAVPTSFSKLAVMATYPSGPGSYAQMPHPLYYTQPPAQATGWAPSSSSSYAQMAPSMGYTQSVAQNAACAPSGPGSYVQMPLPVYYTKPPAQATGWAPSSSSSYAQMAPPMGYTQPVAQNAGWAPPGQMTPPQNTGWPPSGSYAQIPVPMNLTQPTAQATGVPPSAHNSYYKTNINPGSYTQFVQKAHDGLKRDCEDFLAQFTSKRRKGEDGGQSSN
uniref:uncharacterized protein LOC122588014 n=1 Tax=Erigeron canadensis TaxID=72917 RepID=UPI001CB8FF51|nr:uncharacterized protein LOC122588014 [Erigeron canadensis]